MNEISQRDQSKLFRWNLIMGLLHFIQGLIMVFLSKKQLFQIDISLPQINIETRSFGLVTEELLQINLGYTISAFLFLSAIAHLLTISPLLKKWYFNNLAKDINLIRWYEYALSSSVMVVVIAILCGINDGVILSLLFVVNATMNLFGALMEKHNSALKSLANASNSNYKVDWTSFVYGSIVGLVPWIVMGVYFFTSINSVSEEVKIPDFVIVIFPTLFIFFNCFAINMYLQYAKIGKWKDYLFGEKAYLFLSLAAKSTLAWIIWGGTLR
jgi:hypothetical protein